MQPHRGSSLGGPCILVVDDEETVRSLAARVLREAGYQVIELPSAETALALLTGTDLECDLVVSDVRMDGRSGTELAALLATSRPSLPILLISGFADPRTAAIPTAARRDFLQKPFSPEQLVSAARHLLADRTVSP